MWNKDCLYFKVLIFSILRHKQSLWAYGQNYSKFSMIIDEFCIEFNSTSEWISLYKSTLQKSHNKQFTLSDSEVITILITFYIGGYRNLYHFISNMYSCTWKANSPKQCNTTVLSNYDKMYSLWFLYKCSCSILIFDSPSILFSIVFLTFGH